MDSFLNSVYTCNTTINTVNEEPTIYEDQNSEQGLTDQNTRGEEQQGSSEQQCSTARPILNRRRQNNPPELIQAKKRMDDAYHFMQQHLQRRPKDEDDKNSTFGVLVARKLQKLSEERRFIVMAKVHQLFIDEHAYNFSSNYSSSRPNSAATMFSYTPSPPQINIASPPAVASPPEVAFSTDVTALNSATSYPNSATTMFPYTPPPPPQINIASPTAVASLPEIAFSTDVVFLNSATSHENSATMLPYTLSSPQTDAPSPAYYVEYSNDISLSLPNPTSRMVSYARSPPQTPRGNHTTVTSSTAVSYKKPNTITKNTVSNGTSDVLKDFIIIRRK